MALDLGLELLDGGGELGLGGGLLLVGGAGHVGVALDLGLELLDGGGELRDPLGLSVPRGVGGGGGLLGLGEPGSLELDRLAQLAQFLFQLGAGLARRLVGRGLLGERELHALAALVRALQLAFQDLDLFAELLLPGLGLLAGRLGAALGVCDHLGGLVLGGCERLAGLRQRALQVADGSCGDLLVLIEGRAEGLGLILGGLQAAGLLAGLPAGGLQLLPQTFDVGAGSSQFGLPLGDLAVVGLLRAGEGRLGLLAQRLAGREVTLELLASVAGLRQGGLQVRGLGLVLLADGREGCLEVLAGIPADLQVRVELLAAAGGLLELGVELLATLLREQELRLQLLPLAGGLLEVRSQLLAAVVGLGQLLPELVGHGAVLRGVGGHGVLQGGVGGLGLGELLVELLAARLRGLGGRLQLRGPGPVLLVAGVHRLLQAIARLLGGRELVGERGGARLGLLGRALEGLDLGLEGGAGLAGKLLLHREGLGLLLQGRSQVIAPLDSFLELGEGGLGIGAGGLEVGLGAVPIGTKFVVGGLELGGLALQRRGPLLGSLELRRGAGQLFTDLLQLLLGPGQLVAELAGLVLGRVEAVRGLTQLALEGAQGLDPGGELVDHRGLPLELHLLLAGGLVDPLAPGGDLVLELRDLPGAGLLERELGGLHRGLLSELGRHALVGIEGLLEAPHLPGLLAEAGAQGGLGAIELVDHALDASFHLDVDLVAFAHLAGHLPGQGGPLTTVAVLGDGEGKERASDGGPQAHKHGDGRDGHGPDVGIRPSRSEDGCSNPRHASPAVPPRDTAVSFDGAD